MKNQSNLVKDNVFVPEFTEQIPVEKKPPFHQSDVPPQSIKQRHIEANALLIFTGTAANRPTGSTSVKAYFATDTYVLSIWTGSAWKSVTLS